MKHPAAVLLLLALAPAALSAQFTPGPASLIGTWISREPILVNVKFSLTFDNGDYEVDCTLGQTTGVYMATDEWIYFTPLKIGINSGDVGKSDTWSYRFLDPDTMQLASGPISVRLFRKN